MKHSPTPLTPPNELIEGGIYPCPVCHWGQISTLPLMEAMSCNFCQHIFSTHLEQQVLKLADSQPSLSWYWTGKQWQNVNQAGVNWGWDSVFVAVLFVVFPPTIVGFAAYLFPPMPGSFIAWFPIAWTILTFILHLSCVFWVIVEYYQFPVGMFLRALQQQLWGRLTMFDYIRQ
ncbi:MAG: hypothetical protein SAJ12_13375 [Jaaginema sp. PMC 1079.18]|nr:hypothetical protein [Jaaginema sp. PMC 1080.18]MEC4851973.1 hypothetical protein [Jaaginema sp. PMC 1079.18]MEC4868379.1 hypothetical protein [Jaaginema sp. PMC 1078.18]